MRTFIAVEFEPETKEKIEQVGIKIKNQSKKGSFTIKDNYHITLRFLGETNANEIELLKDAVEAAAYRFKRFTVDFTEVGKFQNSSGNIFWLGTKKTNELTKLNFNLSKALESQGYPRDKKNFVPHITLAREAVTVGNPDIILKNIKFEPITAEINKISLMESKFISGRVVYKTLFSSNLK